MNLQTNLLGRNVYVVGGRIPSDWYEPQLNFIYGYAPYEIVQGHVVAVWEDPKHGGLRVAVQPVLSTWKKGYETLIDGITKKAVKKPYQAGERPLVGHPLFECPLTALYMGIPNLYDEHKEKPEASE